MDDRVTERLASLRSEFQQGERQLAELDAQRAQLMETMLRISGAIQVLEELTGERPSAPPAAQPDAAQADAAQADAAQANAPPDAARADAAQPDTAQAVA